MNSVSNRLEAIVVAWGRWDLSPGDRAAVVRLDDAIHGLVGASGCLAFRRHVTGVRQGGGEVRAAVFSWTGEVPSR